MLLILDKNTFSLQDKVELKDENNNLKYWSIYDFAYKNRTRLFDENDNEIGYLQFKVLSSQDEIGFYHIDGNKITSLKLNEDLKDEYYLETLNWYIKGDIKKWNYKVVDKDNKEIMSVETDKAIIIDDLDVVNCLMIIFALGDYKQLIRS